MTDEPKKAASRKNARAVRGRNDKSAQSAKGKPWTFPKNTLEDAIGIAKAIEEKNAGNPMPAQDIAVAVGFRQAQDWRFQDLLRSANQYGLVTGTGAAATIHLVKLGQDVVAPSSPSQRSEALIAAFRNVKDFEAVEKFYGGKRIPEDEFFLNTLTREFNIPRDRVEHFAKVFVENLSPAYASQSRDLGRRMWRKPANHRMIPVFKQPHAGHHGAPHPSWTTIPNCRSICQRSSARR